MQSKAVLAAAETLVPDLIAPFSNVKLYVDIATNTRAQRSRLWAAPPFLIPPASLLPSTHPQDISAHPVPLSPFMKRSQHAAPPEDQAPLLPVASGTPTPKTSAAPWVPPRHTLTALEHAMPACQGCDLYLHATHVVPGKGGAHAPLFLIGEQPGDQEDLQGLPFVGPAGRILHRAMDELSIPDTDVFVTNAVKHFKFVQRGKLRIHQTPRVSEVNACRPWLAAELDAVHPRVVLCLGATAARSLLGSGFSLTKSRGQILATPLVQRIIATYHPSAILRAQDSESSHQLFNLFKLDLKLAHETAIAA